MEKFQNLPEEKQERVINAALNAFGRSGYKKASVADIAAAAGVSKAMIFYWFGNKKELYRYLSDLCGKRILEEVSGKLPIDTADFFERIRTASDIKMSVLRQHPGMLDFVKTVYLETEPEVADITVEITHMAKDYSGHLILDEMAVNKFKGGVDPELLLRFMVWAAEGFAREMGDARIEDMDAFSREFFRCMDMLKQHLYKPEYL